MNQARANILACLGASTGAPDLLLPALKPAFVNDANSLVALLKTKLLAVHASVDIIDDNDDTATAVTASVLGFLKQKTQPLSVTLTPAVDKQYFDHALLSISHSQDYAHCQTVVTQATAGVAETGSLILPSSLARPTLANFLPDNCIVLLNAADIKPHLEDALATVQSSKVGMPRALNIISGPSKTADIEQTLVYGAHGPIQLHVIILSHDA
ncbi:MAG: LUD domain-containing protein [Arenicellales bacterium]